MKKIIISVACLVVLAALYACSNSGADDVTAGPGTGQEEQQGITVNNIPFESLEIDELPADIKGEIDMRKADEGYELLRSGEIMYLVVYAGERPTAGYRIKIESIVDEEGAALVTVREKAPAKGDIVAQVITYPFDIAKLESGISDNVRLSIVKDDKG